MGHSLNYECSVFLNLLNWIGLCLKVRSLNDVKIKYSSTIIEVRKRLIIFDLCTVYDDDDDDGDDDDN